MHCSTCMEGASGSEDVVIKRREGILVGLQAGWTFVLSL